MFLTSAPQSTDVTEDGYDVQWGTNVVGKRSQCFDTSGDFSSNLSTGPFYFTQLLMPAILAAAENSPDKARITFTSSSAQSTIKWDTLTDTPARKKTRPDQRYGQSKFVCVDIYLLLLPSHIFFLDITKANILLANQFAREYGDKGVVVVSLNPGHFSYSYSVCCDHADIVYLPGGIKTELQRHMPGIVRSILVSLISFVQWHSTEHGLLELDTLPSFDGGTITLVCRYFPRSKGAQWQGM